MCRMVRWHRMASTVRRARVRPRHSGRPHRAVWRGEAVAELAGKVWSAWAARVVEGRDA